MHRIKSFFRAEAVLCISALCAAVTMTLVPPDGAYAGAFLGVLTAAKVMGLVLLPAAAMICS